MALADATIGGSAGGLIFGWNSLALILMQQGFFDSCGAALQPGRVCRHQESKLTLVYTVGVFAVNFAPAVCGPLLDWLGPRVTAVAGTGVTALGLVLLAVSEPGGLDALGGGAFCLERGKLVALGGSAFCLGALSRRPWHCLQRLGLGGVAFHLAQFNTSSAFPRARGLVSGAFVVGFVGSGIAFFILRAVINALGGSGTAYRGVLLVYAALVALWVPLGLWAFPRRPLQLGQVYVITRGWRLRVLTLAQFSESKRGCGTCGNGSSSTAARRPLRKAEPCLPLPFQSGSPTHSGDLAAEGAEAGDLQSVASAAAALVPRGKHVDWEQLPEPSAEYLDPSQRSLGSCSSGGGGNAGSGAVAAGSQQRRRSGSLDSEGSQAVVLNEAARFAALKSATLLRQMISPESILLTVYFTVSVFVLQLYLGTSRLQLRAKGDDGTYANVTSIALAAGGVFIPLTHWLVDRRGYSATLAAVNTLGLLCCAFQAVPSLPVQALTLASWCASRVILYSSFYAIVAALFGFRTFGTIIGAVSVVTGLATLLILPISDAANGNLQADDTYWKLNVSQAAVLLPLYGCCVLMWRWERASLVASCFTGAADGRPAESASAAAGGAEGMLPPAASELLPPSPRAVLPVSEP